MAFVWRVLSSDWLRRAVAFLLVAGAVGLFVASRYVDDLQACDTKRTTGRPTVTTCKPYPVADFAPVLILVIALVWVDLSEFELAGLGKVVRRIDEAQATLREGQTRLEHQLHLVQTTVAQNVSQKNETNVIVSRLHAAAEPLREQSRGEEHVEPRMLAERTRAEKAKADFALAWATLRPWSALASRLGDPSFIATLEQAQADGKSLADADDLLDADRKLLHDTVRTDQVDVKDLVRWASEAHAHLELVRWAAVRQETLDEKELEDAALVAHDLLLSISHGVMGDQIDA